MRIIVGRISGLYGVRGWVKVFSYTRPVSNILNYSPWQLGQQGQWRTMAVCEGLEKTKKNGKTIIVRLESIQNRLEAAKLLDAEIAIASSQLPTALKDEYYWSDLEGLTVINDEGITLGQVDHLIETGANDVLVLKGERERLIPFVLDLVVLDVDLNQGLLRVDWDADF